MKNGKILAIALALLLVFNSCEKTDMTVTLKQSGTLKVQLKNSSDEPIKDQKVKLYTSSSSSSAFDIKTTDDDGTVNFGELIQNTYLVVANDVKVGNVKYNISKPVQVISDVSDVIVLNPEDFTGKITLTVKMENNLPVQRVNVALIEFEDYNDTLTYDQILSKAAVTAKTDNAGVAIFEKVPSNYEFMPFVYYADTAYDWATNSSTIYVDRDGDVKRTIYVQSSKILNLRGTLNLTVQYYGYKNSNYGTWPVPNAHVIAVSSDDYYSYNLGSSTISAARSKKADEGMTDHIGNVSLRLPQGDNYYLLVYYSEINKYWYSSIYISSLGITTYSIDVDEYALGLTK
jgi:hypothetical protein